MPDDLKRLIRETIGGKELKLVIQKKVTRCDILPDQNRFLIPANQTNRDDFLYAAERLQLQNRIPLFLHIIQPNNHWRYSRIKFTRWKSCNAKSYYYVLTDSWNTIVKDNGIEEGMVMQLWSFRVHHHLSFAMVTVPTQPN